MGAKSHALASSENLSANAGSVELGLRNRLGSHRDAWNSAPRPKSSRVAARGLSHLRLRGYVKCDVNRLSASR